MDVNLLGKLKKYETRNRVNNLKQIAAEKWIINNKLRCHMQLLENCFF